MATVADLSFNGFLVQLGGGLEPHEQPQRLLYAFQHVVQWLDETLPELEPMLGESLQTPIEQVDDLFHDFVSGANLSYYQKSHSMLPTDGGVWELKTQDVRFFGWFTARGIFVIAEADSAFRCKQHALYAGYRGSVQHRRDLIELDEPKFIIGEYQDVL